MKKKIVTIIQARMGSERLPGKVMKTVMEKPLLYYQLERVKASKFFGKIVIATTKKKIDDVIVKFCKKNSMFFFRGSENDVLKRYYDCAKKFKADIIVRLTADCPIIDPKIIDRVIKKYLNNNYDFVSNTSPPKPSYPDGMDVEVFSFKSLKVNNFKTKNAFDREHVTNFFWKNPKIFSLYRCELNKNLSKYRLTVDYDKDFKLIEAIITSLYKNKNIFSLKNIINFLDKNKKIKQLNEGIKK